jgi:hypothetical protein
MDTVAVSGARTIQCEPKSSAEWPDKHALSPERVEDQVRIVSYNRFEEQHQTCPSSNQCSMDTVNTDETARIVQANDRSRRCLVVSQDLLHQPIKMGKQSAISVNNMTAFVQVHQCVKTTERKEITC